MQAGPVALCYLAGLASLLHNFCSHAGSTYAEVGAPFLLQAVLSLFVIVR
jgi:hypothetical protein